MLSLIPKQRALGTHQRNAWDRSLDGNNPTQKLAYEIAQEIRAKYIPGIISQQDLANEYGVSNEQISRIINNKQWAPELYEQHER